MSIEDAFKHLLSLAVGPYGGISMLSFVAGGWAGVKWIAPKLYEPKMDAMQEQIDQLKVEVAPLRELTERLIPEALAAAKIGK